jgi:DNA replication protein DnaC
MSTAVARNLMAEMKLLGMIDAFDRLATEATREQWSCTDFFDAMLQAENDFRCERKTKRRIKAAKFALRPSFEDFDFTASRSITKAQIKDLYSLHWLADARPVLLIGQTGVGKTFLAQALGLHACASGKSVLYMTFTTWLENLALARSTGTYLKFRDKCARPDAIILDDFGMRKLTATEARICASSSKSARSTSPPSLPRSSHWITGPR